MKSKRNLCLLFLALAYLPLVWWPTTGSQTSAAANITFAAREDAYRANNLGVAQLEQFNYKAGVEQFRRALALDPQQPLANINLAVALYNVPDLDEARQQAEHAVALAPGVPQPLYILGLIARAQNRADDALNFFGQVLHIDPRDVGANVNVGQLYAQQRKYTEAIAAFRAALAPEPYNTTALYNLANALLRSGQREEGQSTLQKFQALRQSGAGTNIGQNYLEQGRYAEAVTSTGAEAELVDQATPAVKFTDATASIMPVAAKQTARARKDRRRVVAPNAKDSAAPRRARAAATGGGAALFDFDGDGDLDLFAADADGQQHLYRNDAGRFVDVSAQAGAFTATTDAVVVGVVAGDYDNDTRPDLFVLRDDGHNRLYHNDGAGKFSDVTTAAGIPASSSFALSAAFADVDHDGDLDIFIAGYSSLDNLDQGAPNVLLRNNGDGKFSDLTSVAKVAGTTTQHAVAVVPTDYDNRRDVDLFVLDEKGQPALYRNLRDGSFRDVAAEVGLATKGRFNGAAAGDVNKDGYTDFFLAQQDAPGIFALSDGQGRFKLSPAPDSTRGASAAQFLDYDNDGLLDLVAAVRGGLRVWRNTGGDSWADVSDQAVAAQLAPGKPAKIVDELRVLLSGDVDADGDTDLIVRSGGVGNATSALRFARNDGGNSNHSVRVRLAGKVSNRSGVEAKIEMRAGSLRQRIETFAASPAPAPADVLFGLGHRVAPDAVRVLWPSGTVQAETEIANEQSASAVEPKQLGAGKPGTATVPSVTVTELDRKPSSCPFLYTWNGERFEFVTDFMGGGEMGDWLAPGVYNTSDPDEYVRIRGDQLKPRDGRYELRVTNELEEALFVDKLQLVAVAHPQGTEVYPNEGLGDAPFAFKLFATRGAHPPAAAHDEQGHDVLARVAQLDRRFVDGFPLDPIRGYAGEHSLTLDLGPLPANKRTLLLLTGWTDYAFSSDNVAASQGKLTLKPPALQVRDQGGRWRTVIDNLGIPIGRPQTLVVDLTGKFLSARHEVRIVTNMRVYWDQLQVDTSGVEDPTQLTRLDPTRADLRWRGFSREVAPDDREPFGYDYAHVSLVSPWKAFPGRYTREGDVRELLNGVDDMFVVSRAGDEISLSFDANALPPLPSGWTRTFLLYADGFSKEMNINSASPHELAPLPFHGMKRYPYRAPESYPQDAAHQAYLERYNTRVVASPLQLIEAVLLNK